MRCTDTLAPIALSAPHVCLILDVAGISRRAGVVSGLEQRLALEKSEAAEAGGEDRSAYLLLQSGGDGRVAIPLSLVDRLEEIPASAVEYSGGREVVQYRNQIIPLVRLSQALSYNHHSVAEKGDPMQVVVYSQQGGASAWSSTESSTSFRTQFKFVTAAGGLGD